MILITAILCCKVNHVILIKQHLSKKYFFKVIYFAQNTIASHVRMKRKTFNRIKSVLAEKNKTGIWLAEQVDVNRGTVSKWCTNQMQPTIEMLFKIADALEVEPRSLLVKVKGSDE